MDLIDPKDKGQNGLGGSHNKSQSSRTTANCLEETVTHKEPGHLEVSHLLVNLKGRVISASLVTAVSQAVQFLLSLTSIAILSRLLTPLDFGLVAIVTALAGLLRIFQDLGLSVATVQKDAITHAQISNLFWINVAFSSAATVAVAISAIPIASFYKDDRLLGITLALSPTFLLSGLTTQHTALLSRQMRFRAMALIQIGALTIGLGIAILLAWLGCGYWSLVGSTIGSGMSTVVFTWLASSWRPALPSRNSGVRPMLRFGLGLASSGLLYSLARGSDTLLIGRTFGPDVVGFYSRATALLLRPLDQFLAPLSGIFVPTLSRLNSDPARYRVAFLNIYNLVSLVSFSGVAALFALARPLTLVVLGPQWEESADILAGLSFVVLCAPLSNLASWLTASQGRGGDAFSSSIATCSVTILSVIIGLQYGPSGVAYSYSAGYLLVQLPTAFYFAGRKGPVTPTDLWKALLKYIPLSLLLWGAMEILLRVASRHSPSQQLLLCCTLGLVILTGACYCYTPVRHTLRALVSSGRL